MAQKPQLQRVYVYDHDLEAAEVAIAALGNQISKLATQPFPHPIYGNVVRLTFDASEEALKHLAAIGPDLIEDLAALPTYHHVGEVSWRVIEDNEAFVWFAEHGIRITDKSYKRWSANTILMRFTLQAPNVLMLEEAKCYLQDRIARFHPRT